MNLPTLEEIKEAIKTELVVQCSNCSDVYIVDKEHSFADLFARHKCPEGRALRVKKVRTKLDLLVPNEWADEVATEMERRLHETNRDLNAMKVEDRNLIPGPVLRGPLQFEKTLAPKIPE